MGTRHSLDGGRDGAGLALFTAPDELFIRLDGQTIESAQQTWQVAVYGVHEDGHSRWVQMKLTGRRELAVTVDTRTDDLADLLLTLGERVEPGVMDVTSSAHLSGPDPAGFEDREERRADYV